jgi:hypothetical protein
VIVAQNIAANTSRKAVKVNCTRREYQDGAQKIYNEINPAFQRVFNVPLEKALKTVPSLNIQVRRIQLKRKETGVNNYDRRRRQ